MPAITAVQGLPVVDPSGKRLGAVDHVLFHPSEPRAVGLEVVPVPLLLIISRKPRYLPLSAEMLASCGELGPIPWPGKRLPLRASTEKTLGYSLDDTVMWRGMEVRLEDDRRVGFVSDAVFSRKSGRVLRMLLSEGSVSDFAVGRTEVPGDVIVGFDGTAIVVKEEFAELQSSGGLAAASGASVAHAKQGVEQAADAVLAAGVVGLGAVERSFRSGYGRSAMRAIRKAGKRVRRTIDGEDKA
jgi:uncharacterized protein YrrD